MTCLFQFYHCTLYWNALFQKGDNEGLAKALIQVILLVVAILALVYMAISSGNVRKHMVDEVQYLTDEMKELSGIIKSLVEKIGDLTNAFKDLTATFKSIGGEFEIIYNSTDEVKIQNKNFTITINFHNREQALVIGKFLQISVDVDQSKWKKNQINSIKFFNCIKATVLTGVNVILDVLLGGWPSKIKGTSWSDH